MPFQSLIGIQIIWNLHQCREFIEGFLKVSIPDRDSDYLELHRKTPVCGTEGVSIPDRDSDYLELQLGVQPPRNYQFQSLIGIQIIWNQCCFILLPGGEGHVFQSLIGIQIIWNLQWEGIAYIGNCFNP